MGAKHPTHRIIRASVFPSYRQHVAKKVVIKDPEQMAVAFGMPNLPESYGARRQQKLLTPEFPF
jgi:hypothetical protein